MFGICARAKKRLLDIYNRVFAVRIRVVVIGPEKSGKSTIVNRMFKGRLRCVRKQRDGCIYRYDEDHTSYVVYDVCGRRSSRARLDYLYKGCDVVLYCVDASSASGEWARAREEVKSVVYRNPWTKRSMLVLGTKNEKKGALGCMEIVRNLGLLDINGMEISCFSVSAEKNTNVEYIGSWIRKQRTSLEWLWGARTIRRWWRLDSPKHEA
ncbi:ADP-ribosylation factor family domain-containing protein [Encephalitozoon hellem]|nr:ADP-ribosylation factor family domain-containing protein [Encephalitozoon hellem]